MRMWMVDPRIMCRRHLLGEHLEIHMFVGSILKGKDLSGFVRTGVLESSSLRPRHQELVKEIKGRGFNHSSPLAIFRNPGIGQIDRRKSLETLLERCIDCRERYGMISEMDVADKIKKINRKLRRKKS